ncbi:MULTISPECIES: peptide deformylase [Clostridiaceae]|uniref:Peptide deformylase n=1 Tax=Clostridium facile TaxID=2763035 RepID=A0ABR7IPN6_9CLOT|nr:MULTISPECIES: peptide deformylase [Clostridiaceae]MBC5787105.1 peptide deformylase [Clostridium facile]PWM99344.1 MAG: peptide deformylase [Massilioclostridium sp.]
MALRNIVIDDDSILRKKCREVTVFDQRLHQLLDDMAETMYQADGVGLAAPQVGVLKRVVVIDVGEGLVELINPEILETSGTQTGSEGCLSYPNEFGIVTRPNKVKVKAYDRNGNAILVKGKELMARALCHEIDHLNGVVFKDLATEMVRE